MKYVAPFAELVSVEALSVILTSGEGEPEEPSCPNQGSGSGWD